MEGQRLRHKPQVHGGGGYATEGDLVLRKPQPLFSAEQVGIVHRHLFALQPGIRFLRDEHDAAQLRRVVTAFDLRLCPQPAVPQQVGDGQQAFAFHVPHCHAVFRGGLPHDLFQFFRGDMRDRFALLPVGGKVELPGIVGFHRILHAAVKADGGGDHHQHAGG